jgi:serine/threonine protein kinase
MSNDERQEVLQQWMQAESDKLRLTRALSSKTGGGNKPLSERYEIIRELGKGSFGAVLLVREKSQSSMIQNGVETVEQYMAQPNRYGPEMLKKEVYAMKVIHKSDMIHNNQEGHIRAERDFLVASAHSRWVVPLIESFQDCNHLYLVMEYMVGGDFLSLLFREDVLPERTAQWYIAEMILCVEETHKMGWIHRDVKPDNFLISASGHLKISDFGLAFDGHWSHHQQYYINTRESLTGGTKGIAGEVHKKNARKVEGAFHTTNKPYEVRSSSLYRHEGNFILDELNSTGKRKLATSIVGTCEYMAPEIIQGDNYDGRCDWWSIGIILYEV